MRKTVVVQEKIKNHSTLGVLTASKLRQFLGSIGFLVLFSVFPALVFAQTAEPPQTSLVTVSKIRIIIDTSEYLWHDAGTEIELTSDEPSFITPQTIMSYSSLCPGENFL